MAHKKAQQLSTSEDLSTINTWDKSNKKRPAIWQALIDSIADLSDYKIIQIHDEEEFESYLYYSEEQLGKTYTVEDSAWKKRMIFVHDDWTITSRFNEKIIQKIRRNYVIVEEENWTSKMYIAQKDWSFVSWVDGRTTAEDISPHWYDHFHKIEIKGKDGEFQTYPIFITDLERIGLGIEWEEVQVSIHNFDNKHNLWFDRSKRISDISKRHIITKNHEGIEIKIPFRDIVKDKIPLANWGYIRLSPELVEQEREKIKNELRYPTS